MKQEILSLFRESDAKFQLALRMAFGDYKMDIAGMFSDYLNSPEPVVRDAATQLKGYAEELQAGSITQAQYNDLCADVVDLQKIDDAGQAIEDRALVQEAFEAMKALATSIPIG